MPTPFPGMDPYLEEGGLWKEIHTQLIVDMARALNRQVSPRYRVAIEQRSYLSLLWPTALVGLPDVMVINGGNAGNGGATKSTQQLAASSVTPRVVELPMPQQIVERYLEIRTTNAEPQVITAIELLSPTNKLSYEGREEYTRKRLRVLGSMTNLVEIDLLRAGQPMAMRGADERNSDYRIVVSRAHQRPRSDLYAFGVRDAIPTIPMPLQRGEDEPWLELNQLLHRLYDELSYGHTINYQQNPEPPLTGEAAIWVDRLLREQGLRV